MWQRTCVALLAALPAHGFRGLQVGVTDHVHA
jgi:hypothetical protein